MIINDICSNKNLDLGSEYINLSNNKIEENDNIRINEVFDGEELIIYDIENLKLNSSTKKAKVVVEPRYANVLTFARCKNIEIDGITFGHTLEKGGCTGGVLRFIECDNITVKNTFMFGCGRIGLDIIDSSDIKVISSDIYECSEGILEVRNSDNISFDKCDFYNNKGYDLIEIEESYNVKFNQCKITNNTNEETEGMLLKIHRCGSIKFEDTEIKDNILYAISDKENEKLFDDININDNFISLTGNYVIKARNEYEYYEQSFGENKKIIYEDGLVKIVKEFIIEKEFTSKPEISPDKSKAMYLFPYEWECLGDLYVLDLLCDGISKGEKIISAKEICKKIGENDKIKQVKWLNNEEILMIIGMGYGTVSVGGDLYKYSLKTCELECLYECGEYTEIKQFTINDKDGKANLWLVKFDQAFNETESMYKKIKID